MENILDKVAKSYTSKAIARVTVPRLPQNPLPIETHGIQGAKLGKPTWPQPGLTQSLPQEIISTMHQDEIEKMVWDMREELIWMMGGGVAILLVTAARLLPAVGGEVLGLALLAVLGLGLVQMRWWRQKAAPYLQIRDILYGTARLAILLAMVLSMWHGPLWLSIGTIFLYYQWNRYRPTRATR
jgi:hypothetical protein